MKILFIDLPRNYPTQEQEGKECMQIEGSGLPIFFSKKGYEVYSVFQKNDRNYLDKIVDGQYINTSLEKIYLNNFNIVIGKNSAFDKYKSDAISNAELKVNIMPLGFKRNQKNCDLCFSDNELIKPPDYIFKKYVDENFDKVKKSNVILYVGTIWPIKNQLEFANLIDPDLISDYQIKFYGDLRDRSYIKNFSNILNAKKINFSINGFLPKKDLAKEMLKSKHSILCTNSPSQPYDPSPRSIPESIYAGSSFLIRDTVLIHNQHYQFGHQYKGGDADSFNNNIKKMIDQFSINRSREIHSFCKLNLSMDFACEKAYNTIISHYNNEIRYKNS